MKQSQQDKSAEIAREYFCRTQSERILDRHLRHDEKKSSTALQGEILPVLGSKKIKTEEPAKELLPSDALTAVLKFVNIESKAFKAVEKIKTLFTEYFTSFHPGQIVQTLYQLSQIEVKFKLPQIQSDCEEIYLFVESKIQASLKPALEILKTRLKTRACIQTDDQFQLTAQIKDLDALVLKLDKMVSEKDDGFKLEAEPPVQNVVLSIKEKLTKTKTQDPPTQVNNEKWQYSEEILDLFNNFQTRLKYHQDSLISCMEMLIIQYRKPWAKASVSQFMFKVNYNYKHIFTPEQANKFDDQMGIMQGLKTGFMASEVNANVNSAKVMADYLKPTFDVSDARATVVVTDNINSWATKQCGL